MPLNVTFEIGGEDPDGDKITYGIDFDGDGTVDKEGVAPNSTSYVYEQIGNYTVFLTVSDGDLVATTDVNIVVAAVGEAFPDPEYFEGTALTPNATSWISAQCGEETLVQFVPSYPVNRFDLQAWMGGMPFEFDDTGFSAYFWNDATEPIGFLSSGEVPPGAVEVYVCASDPTRLSDDFSMVVYHPDNPPA